MCKLQTVSFVKFSQGFEGKASQESNLKRIQRFFADFVVDNHLIANFFMNSIENEEFYKCVQILSCN
jgi:hypothetical protein